MKLTLSVSKPLNGCSFQATEKLHGRVTLQQECLPETPEVHVYLQGIAKITLKPGFDAKARVGATARRQSYKLFTIAQVLHPTAVDGGLLQATFSFAFPQTASCCGRHGAVKSAALCPLPPSTLLSTPGAKIRVSYGVTAVYRPLGKGLCHRLLRQTVTAQQSVAYEQPVNMQLLYCIPTLPAASASPASAVPSDAALEPASQLIHNTAWLPASRLGIECSTGDASDTFADDIRHTLPDGLPPYSPAMTLEAVMLNPPIITPGRPVDLDLFLHTPRSILDAVAEADRQLYLCSVSVRLRRKTRAQIGADKHTDDATWVLWSVKEIVPVQQEKMGIVCSNVGADAKDRIHTSRNKKDEVAVRGVSLPAACVSAIQDQPGFDVCFASRVYTLEVAMGVVVLPASFLPTKRETDKILSGSEYGVQYTRTDIRVMISSPPPDYAPNSKQDREVICVV
ncbi:hypothetical protein SEPCBS119000_002084 [Sporothrix epigloea]|uniref:Arrestin-like N-terminal domain-containing protein n=1 Tax=Sporothrix epigloea TaxID=1892477 RepID=A0ABP0DE85_9PEZI